jgi:hypothetical protein
MLPLSSFSLFFLLDDPKSPLTNPNDFLAIFEAKFKALLATFVTPLPIDLTSLTTAEPTFLTLFQLFFATLLAKLIDFLAIFETPNIAFESIVLAKFQLFLAPLPILLPIETPIDFVIFQPDLIPFTIDEPTFFTALIFDPITLPKKL